MNCYLHADAPAVAFCRSCGRPLCAVCQRQSGGTVFCPEHLPATQSGTGADQPYGPAPNPYTQASQPVDPAAISTSPGLAFLLGWIPGVGAIYNGQYIK